MRCTVDELDDQPESVMESPSFNLVNEPWVPVIEGGRPVLVSLLDALTRAHDLDGLATAKPLETIAVLRQVLLPVYLDACGLPGDEKEWAQRWRDEQLPVGALKSYLTAKDEVKPVSLLLAATATGNNVPLFTARTEAEPPALAPDQAVRVMLATHCWDTAAIKSGAADDPKVSGGKTTGNPTGPCGSMGVVVPIGRTLAETLLLNTPIVRQPPIEDRPQWRGQRVTGAWQERHPTGLLDLLTWQSRRIRLVPELDSGGQVVVRRVVLCAGDRLAQIPANVEPHTTWRQVKKPKAGQPPTMPVRHAPGRAAWRGLGPMLATIPTVESEHSSSLLLSQLNNLRSGNCLPTDPPVQVLTVGVVYGNQSAVVEDVIVDLIPMPVAALDPESDVRYVIDNAIVQAEKLRHAGNRLDDDLRKACGGENLPWDRGLRLGDALMHEFNSVARRLLAGLQRHPEQYELAEDAWRAKARDLAFNVSKIALSSVPPTAFLGREVADKNGKDASRKKREIYRASLAEAAYRRAVRNILGIES
jgi:CRISPR system Cascade subunit CasA